MDTIAELKNLYSDKGYEGACKYLDCMFRILGLNDEHHIDRLNRIKSFLSSMANQQS